MRKIWKIGFLVVFIIGLTACGSTNGGADAEDNGSTAIYGEAAETEEVNSEVSTDINAETDGKEAVEETVLTETDYKEMFGQNCIADQTFLVEMSEYDGEVYFVPTAPANPEEALWLSFMQDGEVLNGFSVYVPDGVEAWDFRNLDAVSFWDVNYDGCTDVVLIMTYGNTTFTNIFYGFPQGEAEDSFGFQFAYYLTESLNQMMMPITVADIRYLLKQENVPEKFTSFQEAYKARIDICQVEYGNNVRYQLINFNDDNVPELVVCSEGYWVTMFTYRDGKVYTPIDRWGYGVMGNAGYEYVPFANSLRNYNNDYAGAVMDTTYMSMNEKGQLETTVTITTYNFDDVNQNGYPDVEEEGSLGKYRVSYIGSQEITEEAQASFDVGEYEYLNGVFAVDEILQQLEDLKD